MPQARDAAPPDAAPPDVPTLDVSALDVSALDVSALGGHPLDRVARQIARGALTEARRALLPLLDAADDRMCALAATLLRAMAAQSAGPTDDALAAALDRVVVLAEAQDEQLRTLLALVEEAL